MRLDARGMTYMLPLSLFSESRALPCAGVSFLVLTTVLLIWTPATMEQRFDPRPHARGDSLTVVAPPIVTGFDPRPHARGDVNISNRKPTYSVVSIHAPTRGATLY